MPYSPLGLSSGFVGFGTVAHRILLLTHKEGAVTNKSIRQGVKFGRGDKGRTTISVNLIRLVRYGFLFRSDEPGQSVWTLTPNAPVPETLYRIGPKPMMKALRKFKPSDLHGPWPRPVASVFEFTGTISFVTDQDATPGKRY
jgi:hypothetical protein